MVSLIYLFLVWMCIKYDINLYQKTNGMPSTDTKIEHRNSVGEWLEHIHVQAMVLRTIATI